VIDLFQLAKGIGIEIARSGQQVKFLEELGGLIREKLSTDVG
jgi:hypothetical protein